jgi:type I restriction enzyme, R subunit
MTNEAFSRVKIDAQLSRPGLGGARTPTPCASSIMLPDMAPRPTTCCATAMAARLPWSRPRRRPSKSPAEAEDAGQGLRSQQLKRALYLPLPTATRSVLGVAAPKLSRAWSKPSSRRPTWSAALATARSVKRDLLSSIAIDKRIVERDYQTECIDTLCREIAGGPPQAAGRDGHRYRQDPHRRRLHQAPVRGQRQITRVLFLVDRIPLAKQTEDAFAEHLPDYPAYVLRAGRRFQDEKRITITTLQSMVNIYQRVLGGYFDLVIVRRVPPLDLRQVERRAAALRWDPGRSDRHALRR